MNKQPTPLAKEIEQANLRAQYDEHVKRLLSDKRVLAHIMIGTIDEFSDHTVDEAMNAITGTVALRHISVDPSDKNLREQLDTAPKEGFIVGNSNEVKLPSEETTYYDIFFEAFLKDGEIRKIYINVEAQKSSYPGYDLVTRGVVYAARGISKQMGTDYTSTDYDGAKKMYSIWICMNPPGFNIDGKNVSETIVKYTLSPKVLYPENLSTDDVWIGRYDLMTVVFVNLGSTTSRNKLLGMLSTLLSDKMSIDEKRKSLKKDYSFPMTMEMEKEVAQMCNLSDLIAEDRLAKQREEIVAEKDAEYKVIIAEKDNTIAEKDALIAQLQAQLAAKNDAK